MKILVTGGAGFIGSNFIRYWLYHHPEDQVVNLDLLTYAGNLESLDDLKNNQNYSFVKGDIGDKNLVFDLMADIDLVVHYAAESHVDRSIMDAGSFIRTNIVGTQILLEAAREHKVRFHHISTDEVFGSLGSSEAPFSETSPYHPNSPYAASKAGADHLVRAYAHTYGIEATISNCSNNYGPYQFPEKIIPLFISNLLEDIKVPVYGDGGQIRDWIYVDDHSKGVEAIIKKGKIGETYCLGGGHEITNLELTKTLLKILNKDESFIEHVKDRPGHDRRYAIDFGKAKRELGWEPKTDFETGLRQTAEWYKNNPKWVEDCKSGDYQSYYERWYGTTSSSRP